MANSPNDQFNAESDNLPAPGDDVAAALANTTTDGTDIEAALGGSEALNTTMASASRTGKGGVDIVR
jgi:hypothetical protein